MRKVFCLLGAFVMTVAVLAGATVADASVVYSTNFNSPLYADGGLIGQDSWAITGASVVNPITVSNTATDGFVSLVTTGQDVNRPFTPAATADSIFVAADIKLSAAQANGDYFLHLSDGGTSNFNARVYAKLSGAGFVMAMGTSSGAPTYGSTVLSFATTYRILARYNFIAGTLNDTGALFVNPADPLGVGDTAYVAATTTGIDATSISAVCLRQGTAGNAPTLMIDNITVTEVPEPTTLGLLAIGGLLIARRRRS